jgi:hypothetical protein
MSTIQVSELHLRGDPQMGLNTGGYQMQKGSAKAMAGNEQ